MVYLQQLCFLFPDQLFIVFVLFRFLFKTDSAPFFQLFNIYFLKFIDEEIRNLEELYPNSRLLLVCQSCFKLKPSIVVELSK